MSLLKKSFIRRPKDFFVEETRFSGSIIVIMVSFTILCFSYNLFNFISRGICRFGFKTFVLPLAKISLYKRELIISTSIGLR